MHRPGRYRGCPQHAAHSGNALSLDRRRYDAKLATIVTANLDPRGLGEQLDPRISSRLQEGVILNMGSRDYRIKPSLPAEIDALSQRVPF